MLGSASALLALFGIAALAAVTALILVLSRKGRTEDRARAYLAGVTYVLSDDPDAAIAELSRAAQLSTETLETYFALGALFRRKGDLERAIRLHQNILLRPGLGPEVKRRALLALALDHRRSGLRDKAEEAFEKILAEEPTHREALVRYRQLLEDAQEWSRAAEIQARLVRLEGGAGTGVVAHLLAAHARAIAQKAPDEALEVAARAVELSPQNADAQAALAQILLAQGRRAEAALRLERAVTLEPELAPRAVALMRAASSADDVERVLRAQIAARGDPSGPYGFALALALKERGDIEAARAQLERILERRPWFDEARRELRLLSSAGPRGEEGGAGQWPGILDPLGTPAMAFACTACRQKLPEHAFRCPSCEAWGTVRRAEPNLTALPGGSRPAARETEATAGGGPGAVV
ncbi:MAG: tetratricopeptide repeat protein [Myxococcaceae bacterium]|nr:tetratricopeptide repeat protein [Myxococcaceae bacterium]